MFAFSMMGRNTRLFRYNIRLMTGWMAAMGMTLSMAGRVMINSMAGQTGGTGCLAGMVMIC